MWGALFAFGDPRTLSRSPRFASFLLLTLLYFLFLLLPGLRPNMSRVVEWVYFGILRGNFLEGDSHVGTKIVLGLLREKRSGKRARTPLNNLVLNNVWEIGSLLF